jgi:hypothetical protein
LGPLHFLINRHFQSLFVVASRTNCERAMETKVTENNDVTEGQQMVGIRAGSSRKLLARKALATSAEALQGSNAIEDSFPAADAEEVATPAHDPNSHSARSNVAETPDAVVASVGEVLNKLRATAADGSPVALAQSANAVPTPAQAWSGEDESTFQALLARRKAAGYQRRGRDVGGQLIAAGNIKPNSDTVVAIIVSIVTERRSINRADLIEAMGEATFPHPKAQPSDKGWCQGYIAGALRNGFLTLVETNSAIAEAA